MQKEIDKVSKVFAIDSDKIVDWIMENRRGKAFIGYERENIKREVEEAYLNSALEVSRDDNGDINGIIVAQPRLHIKQILTNKKSILYKLCYLMNLKFAGLKWTGYRDGKNAKLVEYPNVDRMLEVGKVQLLKGGS